ncbi:TetR/AcrR family transcriptional regulator [Catenulispora sp. NF23]|uniref:TetR/AcrR family transcriptional regulator n=1 Tax=Catenulispora pinistramenti TaxID=2705254 RepID=A0ABS5KI55_9ACTN|nr:TetR/AcrR family transcriptional regulator [Catenulispora pinistramenti]MBS2531270.1 TetR/AcrR family transcriptional regulator [Catenulispora pinistramenti]MBS2545948.1 TetR/AcrR family transcriptional regulator [Catenulispora pinistramenti]
MSNRDDLLAGAKKCLLEKGYSRTTARDIAQASGVSLAAIGYHFGSKDALMNQAMFEAIEQWGDRLEEAFAKAGPDMSNLDRFTAVFDEVAATFERDQALWMASFEMFLEIDHIPGAREMLVGAIPAARTGMVHLILGIPEDQVDRDLELSVGAVVYSLMAGVLVQRHVDSRRAPTGSDLARGLRQLADALDGKMVSVSS